MCTVSFIAQKGSYFITSNRDEHISRPKAFAPAEQTINSLRVLFPKDAKAGGTWFAVNENHHVGVLLNGGLVRHESKGPYDRSRGLVLLEVMGSENPLATLEEIKLKNIEPFTLVLFANKVLTEFRWNGDRKYFTDLDSNENYIWSSVTLYDKPAIKMRNQLFSRFVKQESQITSTKVVDFHSNNHNDFENGFIIDRNTGLKTFSVTQAVLSSDKTELRHFDLLGDKQYAVDFESNPLETSL